jgi:uncharacterized protein YecE (DUF72 family)
MDVRVGTSGFSYEEWKGAFYPEDLPSAKMLRYYATRLSAVEVNNTFYRMPKADVVAKWASEVPDGFSFALKASQRITHRKRLEGAAEEIAYVTTTARTLGDRLGPMLFQLPPFLRLGLERLEAFLADLPDGFPAAIEFRHASWHDERVWEALRRKGVALVWADTDEGEPPLVATADAGYVRLRRAAYGEAELDAWAERIRAQPWTRAHVFFKHEEAGAGPLLAEAFQRRFRGA